MESTLITVPAHFDGTAIRLDVPIILPPHARLLITILEPLETSSELVYEMMAASSVSLASVWDNSEDDVYDSF